MDFASYVGAKLLISVSNCVGNHPHGGPLDLTQAKKIFDFSHQHGKDIDAVEFMVVLFLFYEIDMLLRMFVSISVRLWRKGACHIQAIILCLTALGSFATLFIAAKLIGHKQIAQLDFFDYITGITIGSIAAEMATDLEEPWKPFTAILIYALVTLLLSVVTNKFPRTRRYLYGSPTILMDQGKLYRKNLKKAKLDLEEFLIMCRQQGYFDLTGIQTAVFEYNGKLTILPVSGRRPVTPEDMNRHYARYIDGQRSHALTMVDGNDIAGYITLRVPADNPTEQRLGFVVILSLRIDKQRGAPVAARPSAVSCLKKSFITLFFLFSNRKCNCTIWIKCFHGLY